MRSTAGENEVGDRPSARPIIIRILYELGPLLTFFASYKLFGFMAATAVFLAALTASTLISWYAHGRIPLLPALGTVVALIAGGLTLGLEAEQFIKMRLTILNGLYALSLLFSLRLNRSLLERVLQGPLRLTESGWRGLTWRAGVFLIFLAAANEIVWRTQSTDFWVNFKVFCVIPLDVLFVLSQWPYIKRHWLSAEANGR